MSIPRARSWSRGFSDRLRQERLPASKPQFRFLTSAPAIDNESWTIDDAGIARGLIQNDDHTETAVRLPRNRGGVRERSQVDLTPETPGKRRSVKVGKPKVGFPTFPCPWKSPPEIPTLHRLDDNFYI
jgi:hypothetical protein